MSNIIIPSSPADLKAIKEVIEEISKSMTRAEGERDYQKEAIKELAEKYELDAKYVRRMASEFHKDVFDKKLSEVEDYSELYTAVFETSCGDSDEE